MPRRKTKQRPRKQIPPVTVMPHWNGKRWINVPLYFELLEFANVRRPTDPWPQPIRDFAAAPDLLEAVSFQGKLVVQFPRATDEDPECDAALMVAREAVRRMLDLLIMVAANREFTVSEPFTPLSLSIPTKRAHAILDKLVRRYHDALGDLSRVDVAGVAHVRQCEWCARYFLTEHRRTMICSAPACQRSYMKQYMTEYRQNPQVKRRSSV